MLKSAAGIELTHVPYRGEAPAIPDLVAGRIDLMFLTTAKPLIDEGRVVGLGHTGDGPWFQLPQLKPLTALGLKDFIVPGWNGIMAPKATPAAVVAKLSTRSRRLSITKLPSGPSTPWVSYPAREPPGR